MSLAEDLRQELAAVAPVRRCDRVAELSGLFHGAGSVHLRGRGDVSVHLDLADSAVARRAFSLLRELGVNSEIRTYRRRAFDRATRYQLHVPGREPALAVLHEAGVLDARRRPLEVPPRGARRGGTPPGSRRAADRQLRAVRALEADGVLDDLPAPLREAARLRVRHPSLALAELARKARPPVPRATLHRRLSRIVQLSEERIVKRSD